MMKNNAFEALNSQRADNVSNNLNALNSRSYVNFIVLSLVLGTLYELCYLTQRAMLVWTSFDDLNAVKSELWQLFFMGFRLDMRAVCVVLAFLLLLGLLASLNKSVFAAKMTTGGGGFEKSYFGENFKPNKKSNFCLKFDKFIYNFTLFLATFSSFLIILSTFVNFYYFKTYHNKIDIFIFGLKDDDTAAILKIMWQDYPVIIVLLASILFAWLCFGLCKKILNAEFFAKIQLNLSKIHTNSGKNSRLIKASTLVSVVLANLMLLGIVFIGIRGSLSTFPLREDEHHISPNPLINHISTNPIIAFAWALQHYKEQDSFESVDLSEFEALQNELFPVFRENPLNSAAKRPNVVVVLMESFGLNMLALDDESEFDLLMGFRKHFEAGKVATKGISNTNSQSNLKNISQNQLTVNSAQKGILQDKNSANPAQSDFSFVNFLSNENGTAASFASLFFVSPNANISQGSAKDKRLSLTPFAVYKDAGYSVIYITSGNRSWQNLGDYAVTLGVDAVYDSNFLMSHYPQSKQNANVYGVLDEFAYKLAFELLQKADKPTFIAILTTSNHPPYPSLPTHFTPPKLNLEPRMPFFTQGKANKARIIAEIFAYASNAFGEFIDTIKHSELKDTTIIAASGDHKHRDLAAAQNIALNHAVPLYLYVPSAYTKDFARRGFGFNPAQIGSHKDIFPTLYALSLDGGKFLSLGGRNLFDLNADDSYEFAINSALWIDKNGIYPTNSTTAYAYTLENGFITQSQKTFTPPPNKAKFAQKYQRLNFLQLNYRIFEK